VAVVGGHASQSADALDPAEDVVERRNEAPEDLLSKALNALEEIVSRLVALIERADRSA